MLQNGGSREMTVFQSLLGSVSLAAMPIKLSFVAAKRLFRMEHRSQLPLRTAPQRLEDMPVTGKML